MKWTRAGAYAIESGEYTIAKFYCDEGCTLYGLYRKGQAEAIKFDEDLEVLKQLTKEK